MLPILFLLVLILIIIAMWRYKQVFQQHALGDGAMQHTVNVVVIDKQEVDIDTPFVGESDKAYWIYVQKLPQGQKREFQVSYDYYYALSAGDQGLLTYQGKQFVHFALKRT